MNKKAKEILQTLQVCGIRDDQVTASLLSIVDKQGSREYLDLLDEIAKSSVDCQVSLPLIKVNEITHGDSLELTGCVPAKASLILEDMPYNTTACDWDKEPIDLKRYWGSRMELIKPTGVICLTASQPFTSKLVMSNYKMFKYEWIWKRDRASGFLNAKIMPMKEHESILIFMNKLKYNPIMTIGKPSHSIGKAIGTKVNGGTYGDFNRIEREGKEKYPKTILEFKRPHPPIHKTQKPVGLFEYLIRTYTNEGDLVFDGFGGSGTTAIAAYRTKRNFIVIEKDKRYFEIASKRLYQERNPLHAFE